MSRTLQLLFALCLATLLTGALEGAEPIRLRVLSYNLHHGEGLDGKLDLERIAGVIRAVEPDLVALQEVDHTARRTGSVDQPAELGRLTKMEVAFGGNIDLQGGKYGNAVLSRLPIVRRENHRLPNVGGGEQRGVLEVEVELKEAGQRLLFFATHLDHRRDDSERIASAQAINELALAHAKLPALLAGDLNATPDSKTLAEFTKQWGSASDKPLFSFPANRPTQQIDFILFRPRDQWKVVEVKVIDEAVASDHRPIFAVLELTPAAP